MPLQKAHSQPSSTFSNSQTPQAPSQFASRPFGIQAQSIRTIQQMENAAFAEQKMEATRLEIQAKHGTITPEGQERLTLLQAQMYELLRTRCDNGAKYGHSLERIAIRRPDSAPPVQAKLTIGQPGDKYEQEADDTARKVVQRIHQQSNQPVQPEVETEEEQLQTKPVDNIQRQELSVDEELQMKPMVQRVADGGMAASADVEAGIQRAKGGGQPLADSIKEPMEQAFGADFGGVRIHTDATSDKLNKSIQARAFTTGRDIFFRQGEYSPGSNAGKELLAHELTHVVQQSGGAVQPKVLHSAPKENKIHTKETAESGQALQTRESSQNAEQADTTNNIDTVEVKTDIEDREKQVTPLLPSQPEAAPAKIGANKASFIDTDSLLAMNTGDRTRRPASFSYVNISGPTNLGCGGFDWKVQWVVDNQMPKEFGFVVQKVQFHLQQTPCNSSANQPAQIKTYWEAWPVSKDTVYQDLSRTRIHGYDEFGAKSTPGHYGINAVQGNAKYIPLYREPLNWGRIPEARDIPATTNEPAGWSDGGTIVRHVVNDFNCCTDDKISVIKAGNGALSSEDREKIERGGSHKPKFAEQPNSFMNFPSMEEVVEAMKVLVIPIVVLGKILEALRSLNPAVQLESLGLTQKQIKGLLNLIGR